MSSLFDAPVQLMVLLAAVVAGQDPASVIAPEPAAAVQTAPGPYAFSETVWLDAVRDGYGGQATQAHRGRIFKTTGGRVYVPVQAEYRAILAARRNASKARAVALDLARVNVVRLQSHLKRPALVRDLYAAHVFGLDQAARLAGLAATQPSARVAAALPDLAAAFPEAAVSSRRPATVLDLYQRLPDGAAEVAEATNAQTPSVPPPLQTRAQTTAALMVSRNEKPEVDRAAPLRGIIKETERAAAPIASSLAASRVAGLNWTTEVRRTP